MTRVLPDTVMHEANSFARTPAPLAHYGRQGVFTGGEVVARSRRSHRNGRLLASGARTGLVGYACEEAFDASACLPATAIGRAEIVLHSKLGMSGSDA